MRTRQVSKNQADRYEVDRPHTCVHERNWLATQTRASDLREIISLLIQLEPALDKYRRDADPYRAWDVEGMRAAVDFRKSEAAAKKYSETVVKPTTPGSAS